MPVDCVCRADSIVSFAHHMLFQVFGLAGATAAFFGLHLSVSQALFPIVLVMFFVVADQVSVVQHNANCTVA